MTTFLQLHILTAYPAANLNRDDTGSPKTMKFGGADRLRVSSQSLKRAIRTSDLFASAIGANLGTRSQSFARSLVAALVTRGIEEKDAVAHVRSVIEADKLGKLKKQVESAVIKAPQAGLVVYATSAGRNWRDDSPFVVGRKVYPQESLIVLPDTSEMVAAVRVHETLAGRVRPGQSATVKIDAYSGRVFTGVVDSIGVMAESQGRWMDPNRREYTIKILLNKPDEEVALKPAMRCEATITLGRVEDVPAVPLQAIFTDEMVRFVYVPEAGKYTRVPVKVGRRSDTLAEITAGVSEGTRVLVRDPAPGEVIRAPWDGAQLKLVGLKMSDDGKPVAIEEPKAAKPSKRIAEGPETPAPAAPSGSAPSGSAPQPGRPPGGPRPGSGRSGARPNK